MSDRSGWRRFECSCGRMWNATTRDRFSPSLETCTCGEDCTPCGISEYPIVATDDFGNILKYQEIEIDTAQLSKLRSLDREAEILLSRNEGIHNMHGSRWAIRTWIGILLRRGKLEEGNWIVVSTLINKMRFCDATRKFPFDYERPLSVDWKKI